jgi:hypothetical protein
MQFTPGQLLFTPGRLLFTDAIHFTGFISGGVCELNE